MGLEGAGANGSFFQTFQVQMGSELGSGNTLTLPGHSLGLERTWIPFGFSGSGSIEASLVYGGPGVSRPGSEDDV
jgi:hypothetical protein